jgi:23S rRNA pseudouridine1911/1915/1917 synthase
LPNIIFEDQSIIAVNKPPFMPTHQSQGHFYDTLANSLAHYFELQNRPFVFRSVNRLDKNTSGIILVAKDRLSSAKLSTQMKENRISKSYLAILNGELPSSSGEIKTYIRRREKSIILREVCDFCEDSKIAITQYEVLSTKNGLSLVLATPVTGRTHQLRVHFAHLGAQILGDDLYGSPSNLIDRHALHAYKLTFAHPDTNEQTELFAPLPEDMAKIIENHFGKDFTSYGRK